MEEEVTVWYDGTLSPASAATMPVSWMGPRLSTAVFDGIRAYWDPDTDGLNVFRLDDHMQRFARARRFQRMDAPWSDEELTAAVLEVLRANDFGEDAYVAPNAFFGIDATAAGGGSKAGPTGKAGPTPPDTAAPDLLLSRHGHDIRRVMAARKLQQKEQRRSKQPPVDDDGTISFI